MSVRLYGLDRNKGVRVGGKVPVALHTNPNITQWHLVDSQGKHVILKISHIHQHETTTMFSIRPWTAYD
jgi:hypothetical protein